MNATKSRFGTFGVCALVALAFATSAAEARPDGQDMVYRDPALDRIRPATVAVLPVATVVELPLVERAVEAGWVALYADSKTRWMSADEVRERIEPASAEPGNLAAVIDRQVWRDAAVSPLLAGHLCRLLGVDAVLTVRVDRYEFADGGRGRVGMTAVITSADGERLWSISGEAGHGVPPSSVERDFSLDSQSVFFDPALEPREDGHRMADALYSLMARWAWQLPAPLDEEQRTMLPMLARTVGR